MQVFTNRVGCAYHRKRSKREMALGLLVLLAVVVLCGLAGRDEVNDIQASASFFTKAQQSQIVSRWTAETVVIDNSTREDR